MRRVASRVVAVLAAAAFAAAPAGASPASRDAGVVATAAKSCSSGYPHAVIGGAHKCLRRGQSALGALTASTTGTATTVTVKTLAADIT